jgi:hypothetical protein
MMEVVVMEYTKADYKQGQLIKWFGSWGFILREGRHIFVHLRNCSAGFIPELGASVGFELMPSSVLGKPPQACRVRAVRKGATETREVLHGSPE